MPDRIGLVIRLLIHLAPAGDQQVWWAESPDVSGFSASDETLTDLLVRSTWTLEEIAAERGWDRRSVDVTYELMGTVQCGNPTSTDVEPGPLAQRSDSDVRVAVAS